MHLRSTSRATKMEDTTEDATPCPPQRQYSAPPPRPSQPPAWTHFRVLDLPRELRCKIWEEVCLHDDIRNIDDVRSVEEVEPRQASLPVRRCVPGYFRPCVLLKDQRELLNPNYQFVKLLNRLPSLFLVSKEVAGEAREVSFRHVLVEIDREKCLELLQIWSVSMTHPMLAKMRNLYICTYAEVPRPVSYAKPIAFGTAWPRIYFDYRHVPLFHIRITTDGKRLTLGAQRALVLSDTTKLANAVTKWFKSLRADHYFSSKDLVAVTTVIRETQSRIEFNTWTLKMDEQDKTMHKAEAKDAMTVENRSGNRDWEKAWMRLEPEFRAIIVQLTAPCAQKLDREEDVSGDNRTT